MELNEQILQEADRIRNILRKYFNDTLTDVESTQLWEWVNASPENKAFFEKITSSGVLEENIEQYKADLKYIENSGILENFNKDFRSDTSDTRQTTRKSILRLLKLTAAACIILFIGAYYLTNYKVPAKNTPGPLSQTTDKNVILPGKTGAILTLSDGSEILLDSIGNKTITQRNGVAVQIADGAVSYSTTLNQRTDTSWNTVRTPVGRQYKVVLADNTIVWLNASSAITYPTNFTGPTRNVKVEGEVYMEVAQNVKQPFIVTINDQAQVEVLGTAFNIHAYPEDHAITTTLVTGAVKMSNLGLSTLAKQEQQDFLILKPQQQALMPLKKNAQVVSNLSNILLIKNVNTDKIIAWKNGLFDFQDMNLEEVMKQLARWYDLEVIYEDGVPEIEFYGKMDRGLTWEEVKRFLTELNVKFRVETNRRVIVSRTK